MINISDYSALTWKKIGGIYYHDKTYEASYPEDDHVLFAGIEDRSYWFAHRNRVLVNLISVYSGEEVFFDLGGGNGFVSQALEKAGIESVLVEPGVEGVRNARKRGLINILCTSVEDAGFHPDCIASAGLFDVLEHLEDDLGFLKTIGSLLRRGGLLFITVPAYGYLWSTEDDFAGHYRRYTLENLKVLARKAGFNVHFASYLFSPLPLPIYLFRSLGDKLGWRKNTDRERVTVNEHNLENKPGSRLIRKILDWEFQKIRKGKSIPFGSSCLVVLHKDSNYI